MVAEDSASTEYSVEMVRGVAAVMVIAAHYLPAFAGVSSFAYTGVDLFFVLSGFVFAPYLFGKPLRWGPYLLRRFFRLYPLYAVALLVYAGLRWLQGEPVNYLLQHVFLVQTLQNKDIAYHLNPAFWSLPPEVEFYLLLPLLARWVHTLRQVLWLFAAALALHLAIAFAQPLKPASDGLWLVLSVHLPGLLVEFLLGALAWCFVRSAPSGGVRLGLLAGGAALWCAIASVAAYFVIHGGDEALNAITLLRGNVSLIAAVAYAAMVAAWVGWLRSPPRWLLATAMLLGNLSYGLYLFHNAPLQRLPPLLPGVPVALVALLCLATTVAMAYGLHRLVEAPMRAYGRGLAQRRAGAASHAPA